MLGFDFQRECCSVYRNILQASVNFRNRAVGAFPALPRTGNVHPVKVDCTFTSWSSSGASYTLKHCHCWHRLPHPHRDCFLTELCFCHELHETLMTSPLLAEIITVWSPATCIVMKHCLTGVTFGQQLPPWRWCVL